MIEICCFFCELWQQKGICWWWLVQRTSAWDNHFNLKHNGSLGKAETNTENSIEFPNMQQNVVWRNGHLVKYTLNVFKAMFNPNWGVSLHLVSIWAWLWGRREIAKGDLNKGACSAPLLLTAVCGISQEKSTSSTPCTVQFIVSGSPCFRTVFELLM